MKFCTICDNMLYDQLGTAGELLNVCKCCGNNTRIDTSMTASCIMENNYADDSTRYKQYMKSDMERDNTLPHATNIDCPNPECTRKVDDAPDVVYVKYDVMNVKFLYKCCHCTTCWISSS